ncbi:peroxiredoxin-6-like [Pelodytes ibericus]
MPGLLFGDIFPNFEAETTVGKIKFNDYVGDSWGFFFSHPQDYTPVCTTELAVAAKLEPEFKKLNVKMIALSTDTVDDHLGWIKDINALNGDDPKKPLPFPIIADPKRDLCYQLGMLSPEQKGKAGMPVTVRSVYIIGPDKKVKCSIMYPTTTGRDFNEILRVITSIQLTWKYKVSTPANWKPGDNVLVPPNIPEEEAKKLFKDGVLPKELPSGKNYLLYAKQPN